MITLKKIVFDLLLIIRGSNVSQSETINKRQIEDWVHQYREKLIQQIYDKRHTPGDEFISEFFLKMEPSLIVENSNTSCDMEVMKSTRMLPDFVNTVSGDTLFYVGNMYGGEYTRIPYSRVQWLEHKKYAEKSPHVYIKNNYLFTIYADGVEHILCRGIVANPTDLADFVNEQTGTACYDSDTDKYPISGGMLTTLKSLILEKELGIIWQQPSDKENDGENIVSSNTR
jgi:hypothetical protein